MLKFWDSHGDGLAEPEAWLEFDTRVVLFECKLTARPEWWPQVEDFYKPLIERLLDKPVDCCIIARNLTPTTEGELHPTVEHFIASQSRRGIVHWTI